MKRSIEIINLIEALQIKTVNVLIFAAFIFFCSIPVLYADATTAATGTGGQPGQFLAWGAGARALGMGNAFYSVSDDASASYWNPAGLTQLDRKELMALHVTLFADTSYDFISYVHPTPRMGVFGFNLTRLSSTGFEKIGITYDNTMTDITSIQNLGTFDSEQTAFTAAYGRKIKENISIGVSGKYISQSLDTSSNGFATFDASILINGLNPQTQGLRLGFGIQNLLSTSFGDTDDQLPLIFKGGASYRFLRDKLVAALDLSKNMSASMTWNIGAEYWLMNFLAMRMGFQGESGIRETSAGFGVKYKDYSIDYAFGIEDLGLSNRISASWRFGPSIVQNREALVRKYLQEGVEAYRQGNFILSVERIDAALDIEPGNKEAQKMYSKAHLVVGYVPSATGESEEVVSVRKGIAGYIEGDNKTAVNALRYAYYKNPQNMKLLGLLNAIEKECGIKETDAQKEEVVGFTIIDQKVYDARQAIIEGKYDEALMKCQEVLNLEPENLTALEIMGSAFFMMDQPERAKEIWMKVLELDPTNKVVPEFLNQLPK
jgi:tetratricopeptide (TPR) repeat protein